MKLVRSVPSFNPDTAAPRGTLTEVLHGSSPGGTPKPLRLQAPSAQPATLICSSLMLVRGLSITASILVFCIAGFVLVLIVVTPMMALLLLPLRLGMSSSHD